MVFLVDVTATTHDGNGGFENTTYSRAVGGLAAQNIKASWPLQSIVLYIQTFYFTYIFMAYIYIYVQTYTNIYIYIYIYVCMYIYVYIYISMHAYAYTYTLLCIHKYR